MPEADATERRRLDTFGWSVTLAAALLLSSPSLGVGLQTEDLVHRAAARATSGFVNLFGGPADARAVFAAKDIGGLPWVAADDLRIAPFRPLASVTHLVDYRGFGDLPIAAHVHSIAWYVASIAAVGLLFRRLAAGPIAALLATFFYAVDDAHGTGVGWLANRSVVMATTFGALALVAHDRWRREGVRWGAPLVAVCATLGLLSGEIALGAVGYAAAHVLFLEEAPGARRLGALTPWALSTLAWALPYKLGGWGARGSGAYVDPAGEPGEFVAALAERWPRLALAELTGLPAELLGLATSGERAVGVALAVLVGAALAPRVRQDPRARFWLTGAALATVPACGTFPADRLLHLAAIGPFAVASEVIVDVVRGHGPKGRGGAAAAAIAAVGWVLAHGIVSPAWLPGRSLGVAPFSSTLETLRRSAFDGVSSDQELILLNAPDYYAAWLLLATQAALREPLPERPRVLYGGRGTVHVRRPSATTLVLRAPGSFVEPGYSRVYRGLSRPMKPGEGAALTGLGCRVLAVDEGGMPTEVEFSFDTALDDPGRVFRRHDGQRYVPWAPPEVGEELELAAW